MSDFQKVSYKDKRAELKSIVESVTNNFGEDFVFYEVPKASFLTFNSNLERKEIQENGQGEVRHIDVFWNGPMDENTTQLQTIDGLFRQGNLQMGVMDSFGVSIHYGVSYDNNDEIDNREDFEDFLSGYSPKGILPTLREKEAIENTNGTGKSVLLSMPTNVAVPPVPRSLDSSGQKRAHYADFRVLITDL